MTAYTAASNSALSTSSEQLERTGRGRWGRTAATSSAVAAMSQQNRGQVSRSSRLERSMANLAWVYPVGMSIGQVEMIGLVEGLCVACGRTRCS